LSGEVILGVDIYHSHTTSEEKKASSEFTRNLPIGHL